MSGTRDQVQAHAFAARRQSHALLRGADEPDDLHRRTSRAVVGGVVVAVLALAASGVVGLLTHRGSEAAVPSDGVIVDAGTRGAYVLVDGVLHPTLNLASAELLAGHRVTTVPSGALRGLRRGRPVGIPGAPDALPPPAALSRGRWTVCSAAPAAGGAPRVTVSIGAPAPRPLAAGVVAAAGGITYLLDGGVRYRVSRQAVTLLGLDQVAPVPIDPAVLDVVPAGPDLEVPRLAGAGAAPAVRLPFGAAVGDLVRTPTDGPDAVRHYVVLADGLAPVDVVAYALLAGAARTVHTVDARVVARAPSASPPAAVPAAWPHTVGAPAAPPPAGAPLCVTYDPAAPATAAAWPVTLAEPPAPPVAAHAVPGADSPEVAVPAGGGAVVRAVSAGGVDGTWVLVTDSGVAYPVADRDTVARLGYPVRAPVRVPRAFVALLPSGPDLDPAAAGAAWTPTGVPAATPSPR